VLPSTVRESVLEEFMQHRAPPVQRLRSGPFAFLERLLPEQVASLIRREHPQTVALVLTQLAKPVAMAVLEELPAPVQASLQGRAVELQNLDPEVLELVRTCLEERLARALEEGFEPPAPLLGLLNHLEGATEQRVLTRLAQDVPSVTLNLKLCDYADLEHLTDDSLSWVLRLVDLRDLALALKGTRPALAGRLLRLLPPDLARTLRADVEALGMPAWEEVRAAQHQIRNILRGLVNLGKVSLERSVCLCDSVAGRAARSVTVTGAAAADKEQ
jgi:flagellar motor switch protein FliG